MPVESTGPCCLSEGRLFARTDSRVRTARLRRAVPEMVRSWICRRYLFLRACSWMRDSATLSINLRVPGRSLGRPILGGPSHFRLDWSERRDLNPRPLAPEASALPGCATLRPNGKYLSTTVRVRQAGTLSCRCPVRQRWRLIAATCACRKRCRSQFRGDEGPPGQLWPPGQIRQIKRFLAKQGFPWPWPTARIAQLAQGA